MFLPRTANAERKASYMSEERQDIDGMGESASGKEANDELVINEKNIRTSVGKGINTPYARVLLRVALLLLVVGSIGLFATGVVRYTELQREKASLEAQ